MKNVVNRRNVWTSTAYSSSRSAVYERNKRRDDEEYRARSLEYHKQWLLDRPGYRSEHPEKKRIRSKAYRMLQYFKHKEKMRDNPQFVIASRLRARMRSAIRANMAKKSYNTIKLLGCSFIEFRKYIESKWSEGMSWDNRREWHIDHIAPCASFDLTNPDHQKTCFHYTNMQPLWRLDNLKKGARVDA